MRASSLGKAGPRPGVFHDAVIGERLLHPGLDGERAIHRTDHGTHGDAVLAAEFEIALIVRGHGHDGAGAVAHQDEVADPDGSLLAAVRIDGVVPGEEAFLENVAGPLIGARVHHRLGLRLSGVIEQIRGERMLRRQNHAGGAVDGVDARGEDANRARRSLPA